MRRIRWTNLCWLATTVLGCAAPVEPHDGTGGMAGGTGSAGGTVGIGGTGWTGGTGGTLAHPPHVAASVPAGSGAAGQAPSTCTLLTYHGGPLMTGGINVYYIWYGDWLLNTAPFILTDFAQNIGGSDYWALNTRYQDASQASVSPDVTYGGATIDSYSHGANLQSTDVRDIVASAIQAGSLPADDKGVYFVLTSADVSETGAAGSFCTVYCGWHTSDTISGKTIKYAFVGNGDRCSNVCESGSNQTQSPNDNPGADAMASVIAHELSEAATDPELDAWYDPQFNENADECAWDFGPQYPAPNGATANVKLGDRHYLIQQAWVNDAPCGYCSLGEPPVPPSHPVHRCWSVPASDHLYTVDPAGECTPASGYGYERSVFRLFENGTPGATPFYRWWSLLATDHFYTIDPHGEGAPGYQFEGDVGWIATSPASVAGTVPLYRWWNGLDSDHFYTIDPNGEGAPAYGYHLESVAGYVLPP